MKNQTKKSISTILAIFLLTFSIFSITITLTNAHSPAWEITSYAFIEAAPDPVGINQPVYILMWVDWPIPDANMNNDVRRANYTLTITKPDQTTETQQWPTISDTTGIQFYTYMPDQVGTYTLDFDYAGQIYTWNSGRTQKTWNGDVFLPDNATTTITVQEDPISAPIYSYPLPNEYWTRPIEGQNTDWWTISSHWLGSPHIRPEPNGRYQMDGLAPNSAHIMWSKPYDMGGIVGGTLHGPVDGQMFYTGSNYDVSIENPLIMYGRFYYPLTLGGSDGGGGYMCIDLQTGEDIWYADIPTQSMGQILDYQHPNQHGTMNGVLWYKGGRRSTSWNATDPLTGRALYDLTDVPSGTEVYGPNGEILRYILNSEGKWLALWNTTVALGAGEQTEGAINATDSYSWNITLADLPAGDWDIDRVFYNDVILCDQGNLASRTSRGQVIESDGANITVISIEESTMGQVLWTKYFPPPEAEYRQLLSIDPESRVFIIRDKESMNLWAYSLDNGNLLWGPTRQSESDWDYFHASSYTYAIYGNLYTAGMDGVIECRNITTGEMKWTYGNGGEGNTTNSGLQTPFGNYPLNIGAFADGKIYTFCFEHTADSPIYKGYTVRCIDAFTGEELWQIDSFVLAGGGGLRGTLYPSLAIADGYLVYLNGYDMKLYCIGKGPSQITAQTPLSSVTLGSNVMITGSVTDQSAGTMQEEQRARFPNGVPVMSDESMGAWMEYVYMQKPRPMDAIGVSVNLEAIDPNGNYQFLGTTTTDAFGNYGLQYEPEVPGTYMIIATFEGSESYWGSTTTAYLVADEAPSPATPIEPEEPEVPTEPEEPETPTEPEEPETPTEPEEPETPTEPEQPAETPLITTEVAIIVAVAVASIIGIGAFWYLRKR